MSITYELQIGSYDKVVIPCPGKMIYSNLTQLNKVLCFVLNKAYVQFDALEEMIVFLRELKEEDGFYFVGDIEKVKLMHSHDIVYRQRLYFKDFGSMLDKIKYYGLGFDLGEDFHISIDNVVDCKDALPYLKVYASEFNQEIEDYLTDTCIVQISDILNYKGIVNNYEERVETILRDKVGYLNRAPLILSSFHFEGHKSSIFLMKNFMDKRMYVNLRNKDFHDFGFTFENVNYDKRHKVFKDTLSVDIKKREKREKRNRSK